MFIIFSLLADINPTCNEVLLVPLCIPFSNLRHTTHRNDTLSQ